jgi:2-hydroxy-3-oxopropionate reductase
MNALDTARELNVPDILTSKVLEIMKALRDDGKAKYDHGGIIQFYEKAAKVEVRKKN